MMARSCSYVEKVFHLGSRVGSLRDRRPRPAIPVRGVFAWAFTMFATARGSLHGMESDVRAPSRLRGLVGPQVPSSDTVGRVYALMDSTPLREMLRDLAQQLGEAHPWVASFRSRRMIYRVPDPHDPY